MTLENAVTSLFLVIFKQEFASCLRFALGGQLGETTCSACCNLVNLLVALFATVIYRYEINSFNLTNDIIIMWCQ
jgi:hypothetical protein